MGTAFSAGHIPSFERYKSDSSQSPTHLLKVWFEINNTHQPNSLANSPAAKTLTQINSNSIVSYNASPHTKVTINAVNGNNLQATNSKSVSPFHSVHEPVPTSVAEANESINGNLNEMQFTHDNVNDNGQILHLIDSMQSMVSISMDIDQKMNQLLTQTLPNLKKCMRIYNYFASSKLQNAGIYHKSQENLPMGQHTGYSGNRIASANLRQHSAHVGTLQGRKTSPSNSNSISLANNQILPDFDDRLSGNGIVTINNNNGPITPASRENSGLNININYNINNNISNKNTNNIAVAKQARRHSADGITFQKKH